MRTLGPSMILRLAIVLAVAVIVGLPAVPTPAAAQATDGPCPEDTGVTVVVDFQDLDRPELIRCAQGPVGSGFEALAEAGIAVQTVTAHPGFVCRLEGLPADQPCVDTPPADAYWSYWSASRGGEWQYEDSGAGNRVPPPGSVEGWSFSTDATSTTNSPPRMAPPAPEPATASVPEPPAPDPAPAPPPPPAPAPAPAPPPVPPPAPAPAPPPPAPGPAPPPAVPPPPPADAEVATPTADPDGTSQVAQAPDAIPTIRPPDPRAPSPEDQTAPSPPQDAPADEETPTPDARTPPPGGSAVLTTEDAAGSPVATLIGVGVVAGVAGVAGLVAVRRRQDDG